MVTVVYQLMGGLRSSMGYIGAVNISDMWDKAKFVKVSATAVKENHVHDVAMTKEPPNYLMN
jgi:IMP dehydrogenase